MNAIKCRPVIFKARQLESSDDPNGPYEEMTDAENDPIEGDDFQDVLWRAEQECREESDHTEVSLKSLLARVYIAQVEVVAYYPWSEPEGSVDLPAPAEESLAT